MADGGISTATLITSLLGGLSVGGSALQAGMTYKAGQQAKYESGLQAKAEEVAATQREADRKYRLANALASQNASAGSRGIMAFEGSPLAVMQEDIRMEEQATQRDRYMTDLTKMTLRAKGDSAAKAAKYNAFAGLLSDTIEVARSFKSIGGSGGNIGGSSKSASGVLKGSSAASAAASVGGSR